MANFYRLFVLKKLLWISMVGMIGASVMSAQTVHAQRPSLAGLQEQIDELKTNPKFETLEVQNLSDFMGIVTIPGHTTTLWRDTTLTVNSVSTDITSAFFTTEAQCWEHAPTIIVENWAGLTGSPRLIEGRNQECVVFYVTGNGDIWAKREIFAPEIHADDIFANDIFAERIHCANGDFAELLPATKGLEPGEVLVIGSDGLLTQSTEPYQTTVVGIHSSQPGFFGGAGIDTDLADKVPLAVVGIVPVKASAENGPIQPGDLLVASGTPGYSMKAGHSPPVGTVIGKALEGLDGGTRMIQMLVSLQ